MVLATTAGQRNPYTKMGLLSLFDDEGAYGPSLNDAESLGPAPTLDLPKAVGFVDVPKTAAYKRSTVDIPDFLSRTRRFVEADREHAAGPRRSGRRRRGGSLDRLWFAATVTTMVVCLVGFAVLSVHKGLELVISGITQRPCIIGVTVKPGDSLWRFARRYGAPENYILDNVDAIAQDNALDPSATLVPGQRLRIHVENPVLLAKLQRDPQVAANF